MARPVGLSPPRPRSVAETAGAGGSELPPIDFHPGDRVLDQHCDLPPYGESPHLKLQLDRWVVTSVGLVVRKAG